MLQSLFLLILLHIAWIAAVEPGANTEDYDAASKAAGKALILGRQYAFKDGKRLGHQRLIVGKVVPCGNGLDFDAIGFALVNDASSRSTDPRAYIGAKCKLKVIYGYSCEQAFRLKFQGEVKGNLQPADIAVQGGALIAGNDRYNVLTNNCQIFASKLFQQIKVRDLALDILVDSGGSDSYEITLIMSVENYQTWERTMYLD